ncbi:MAG: NAD(P)/FAD-dependent oxidoreductase [Bacteroidota bacterium]
MKVGIVGGGAAGFFSAIAVKENFPDASVVIYEKSEDVLSKVRITGGGRCNVSHDCESITDLCKAVPRGGKSLKKAFHVFNDQHTMAWFRSRGVPLVVQADRCVFPESNDARSIVDCLIREAKRLKVEIQCGKGVIAIRPQENSLSVEFAKEDQQAAVFDKIIVTTGGSPKRSGLEWLETLNHRIENPVPSLFTFNMPSEPIISLMGVVAENTVVRIQGTKVMAEGALLITHWGMSGPVILKLSSYGARVLHDMNYDFKIQLNWVEEKNNELVLADLQGVVDEHPYKLLSNHKPYPLPSRLWQFLLDKSGFPPEKIWGELGKKGLNKMMSILTNDEYSVRGKTTFKEEFVTCGGVSLDSIDMSTMQSKVCKNLYFAGEIMDIDAITGGYNLQCAWTTGFVAGKLKS